MTAALKSLAHWLWNEFVWPVIVEVTHRVVTDLVAYVIDKIVSAATRWIARLLNWTQHLINDGVDEHDARITTTNLVIDGLATIAAKAEMYRDSDAIDEITALFEEQASITA